MDRIDADGAKSRAASVPLEDVPPAGASIRGDAANRAATPVCIRPTPRSGYITPRKPLPTISELSTMVMNAFSSTSRA